MTTPATGCATSPTLFLVHDRPIHIRTDDSVVRSLGRGRPPLMMRRSRGYVPASVDLPLDAPPLLACGAELKSVFCLAKGRRAWPGHHIGDLKNYETLRSFTEGVEHFEALFAVEPELVAHDLHPEYLSTKYAPGAAGRGARRGPAPPRSSGGVPRGARRGRARGRGDLRRERVRHRRLGLGRGAAGGGPGWVRARRFGLARAVARRGYGCEGGVADGARVDGPRRASAARRRAGALGSGGGAVSRAAPRRRSRLRWGGCSTRSPRCAGCAPR